MTALLNFDAVQLAAMRKGWGIKETARNAGVSDATLFQIRKRGGRGYPRTFGKVARALGVDVTDIVTFVTQGGAVGGVVTGAESGVAGSTAGGIAGRCSWLMMTARIPSQFATEKA